MKASFIEWIMNNAWNNIQQTCIHKHKCSQIFDVNLINLCNYRWLTIANDTTALLSSGAWTFIKNHYVMICCPEILLRARVSWVLTNFQLANTRYLSGQMESTAPHCHVFPYSELSQALGRRNFVADKNLGDGATFWKLFLALIGSCRQNKYCH